MSGLHLEGLSDPEDPVRDASAILRQAAELVSSSRAAVYGDKYDNHRNIARLWNAYLDGKRLLVPLDVAIMMLLLKVARTKSGTYCADNYTDACGYAGIAGQLAATDAVAADEPWER